MGTFCATQSQSQAWIPAPKCCLSVSPGVCSPAWLPGLASRQLQGHEEDRQTLAAAQGGSHSQEGARENREDRLPSCSPQTQLDVHPTAEGSAWGRRQRLLPTGREGGPGAGTPCSSGTGTAEWMKAGQVLAAGIPALGNSQWDCGSLSGAQVSFTLFSLCQH